MRSQRSATSYASALTLHVLAKIAGNCPAVGHKWASARCLSMLNVGPVGGRLASHSFHEVARWHGGRLMACRRFGSSGRKALVGIALTALALSSGAALAQEK